MGSMITKKSRSFEEGRHPVTLWIPDPLLARLDAHLARLAGQVPGGRVSRQSWFLALLERELGAAPAPPEQDPPG